MPETQPPNAAGHAVFRQLQADLAAVPSPKPEPHDSPADCEERLRQWAQSRRTALARAIASLGTSAAATGTRAKSRKAGNSSAKRHVVRSPQPWTGHEPAFDLALDGGFFGMDQLHPTELVHLLAIGGTGTGKTRSAVLPLMRSIMRSQVTTDETPKRAAMFIVDPKKELLPEVVDRLKGDGALNRLLHLGADSSLPPVGFFEPDDGLTSREKLARLNAVLRTDELGAGDHAYWQRTGLEVLEQFMELERAFRTRTGGRLLTELAHYLELPRREAGFWETLSDLFGFCMTGRIYYARATLALEDLLKPCSLQDHRAAKVLTRFRGGSDLDQFHYRAQSAEPLLALLGDEGNAGIVDFDPFPDADQPRLELRTALDAGGVLLYQPEPVTSSEIAARAIKAKVFEAVRSRSDMARPVGIVVDEYQKFITCDAESGDATFLDTARAYRANCVLATQSIGALRLALGSTAKAHAAVEAIVANTPSKWFFGSKDEDTARTLRALIPALPGGNHILDARSLAGLGRGEAYWSLADGRWGRGRADLGLLL